jgi:hypothetical protein
MVFITLDDVPMDPSPRPPNQLTGLAQPRAIDRACVTDPRAPHVTNPCVPRVDPCAHRVDPCPNQADRPRTPTIPHNLVIFTVRSTIFIKRQLFSSFG